MSDYDYLYFKNGKPKKKYMYCLNRGLKEMRMLYGQDIIQCGGCNCSYYSIGCGRMKLNHWDEIKENEK